MANPEHQHTNIRQYFSYFGEGGDCRSAIPKPTPAYENCSKRKRSIYDSRLRALKVRAWHAIRDHINDFSMETVPSKMICDIRRDGNEAPAHSRCFIRH